jgi:hypothetical protein
MGLSLCGVGPSFQGGQDWNIGLQRQGADVPLATLLGYQSPNNTSYLSNSPLAAGRPSSSTSHERDTMVPITTAENPSKQRRLMLKSINTASGAIGVVGDKNASMQAAKRAGRKGRLSKKKKDKISKMRQKTACAACFASHVEVSGHRCECSTICLTVIQVL